MIQWEFCGADLNPINEISVKTYDTYALAMEAADDVYDPGTELTVFSFIDDINGDFRILETIPYVVGDSHEDDFTTHMKFETKQSRFV